MSNKKPLPEDNVEAPLDNVDSPIIIPTNKLDADEYSADDLDGVTESVFGSGNLSYASLQASQTDSAMFNNGGDTIGGDFDLSGLGNANLGSARGNTATDLDNGFGTSGFGDDDTYTDIDRPNETTFDGSNGHDGGSGNFASATVGSLSASQLANDKGSFSDFRSNADSNQGFDGRSGIDGTSGTSGADGNNGNGNDGRDGQDGTGGGGDTINIDITKEGGLDIDVDLGDVFETIDNVFIELGDAITNITNTVNNVTEILGDIINNLTDIDITDIINQIIDIKGDIIETVINVLNEIGDLNLEINLLDTIITELDIPLSNLQDLDLNVDVNLEPTITLVNDLADYTGLEILSDALADLDGTVQFLQGVIDDITGIISADSPEEAIALLNETINDLGQTTGDLVDSVNDAVGGVLDTLGLDGSVLQDGLADEVSNVLEATVDDVVDILTAGSAEGAVEEIVDAVDGLADSAEFLLDGTAATADDVLDMVGIDDNIVEETVDDIIDIVAAGSIEGAIEETVDAVENLGETVEDLLDPQTIDDVLSDTSDTIDSVLAGVGENLLGGDNDGGNDSDLVAALDVDALDGTPLGGAIDPIVDAVDNVTDDIDVVLDPVEDLVGDVDLGLDGGIDLLGDSETNNEAGDTDLNLGANLDILDTDIVDVDLGEVNLDPLEADVGDIDLDLGLATDIFNNAADPDLNEGLGGSGDDTLLSDLGDFVEDVGEALVGGVLEGVEDALLDDFDPHIGDVLAIDGGDETSGDGGLPTLDDVTDTVFDDNLIGEDGIDLLDDTGLGEFLDPLAEAFINDDSLGIEDVTDPVLAAADDFLDNGLDIIGSGDVSNDGGNDSDLVAALDVDALDGTPLGGAVDPIVDAVDNVTDDIDVVLDPVEDLAGDVDLELDGGIDLLGDSETSNDAGDTDLNLGANLDILDTDIVDVDLGEVNLDPLEAVVGDIDLDLGLATDLLNNAADPDLNEGLGGSGDDTLLSDLGDFVEDAGEALVGGVLEGVEDALLDDFDPHIGDVLAIDGGDETSGDGGLPTFDDTDLDISDALSILDGDNAAVSDLGDIDDTSWTETTLDAGGLFDDVIGGLSGEGDVLPDPTGTMAEGLGALDITPDLDAGSLGGLFG
ncbi:MAG TPA: hypothetical protein EYG18_00810 [Micavibrio sp.]|nr:hypothetical protein [Micavibrio sp.]HIL27788.1 hypothetical protein [Micavibrio sp.]